MLHSTILFLYHSRGINPDTYVVLKYYVKLNVARQLGSVGVLSLFDVRVFDTQISNAKVSIKIVINKRFYVLMFCLYCIFP